MWGAVRCLFEINLHVICFVSDGASTNQRFYMDHYCGQDEGVKDGVLFKTRNIYEPNK